jgi:DNA mismatch repair protein MutS
VAEGPANQSYGLQVAQLAGVPAAVIRAARRHLAELESKEIGDAQGDLFRAPSPTAQAERADAHPALELLRDADPDQLAPKAALDLLYRLKRLAE